uniref:TIR domain-containing protein n=1 Tax=Brassica oleracea TaxID=3712 RepID=A0A3P6CC73_BRAOL|nr:unnamed protein product [Brassica oleracea]
MASSSASKYDVFLTFRGEDTRHSIVSHLYAALTRRGLFTFKDDKKLEIGDRISEELRRAIQGSDFVVVVLSEKYATSRWCLMELQLIMELQREGRLSVFPVFYKVEPSSVRHQLRSFDLERYQRDPVMAKNIPMWREALNQIAGLSGMESRRCVDEATMVEKIARDISRRKTLMRNIDSKHIVGVETHMQGLKSLLDMDSENYEVRMIGIWGMGGIGKTTIAKCLYDQLSFQFEATYFTQDIKGIHKGHDLINLQKKLLVYNTLGDDISLWSVEAGREEIKARLGNHKVLLVLDGVDKIEQVHALAKETSWFGPRSRIIITTRDRGLLRSCGVKTIYEVKCLDDKGSMQMFKQIAFEGRSPPCDDFEQLSLRAVRLAHGLPSAIKAYALFLRARDNSLEEWEEAVCGLESATDENIMEILKLSYDGLAKKHQNVFLQVACLFNGETYQRIITLLDGSGHERNLCIRVLAERSLISITTNGYVILHKLVEQMGRGIMLDCQNFIGDPEKVVAALVHGEGTEQTECISLHTCEMTCALSLKKSVFELMYKLKFFKVYKHVNDIESRLQVTTDDDYLCMPCNLKLFHWDAFPLTTLPLKAGSYFLVELNLRYSNLETLWNEKLDFENLKKLDVTGSKNLKQLPDLSDVKNLEELILEQCTRLEGVPESIGYYKPTLRRLVLSYYGGPESPMRVVVRRKVTQSSTTLEFPTAEVRMKLGDITIAGDVIFHFSSSCQGNAEYFSLSSSEQHSPVQQAPRVISEFNKFETLNIRRFSYEENGRPVTFHSFPNLLKHSKVLDLSGNDFKNLPSNITILPRLRTLWLRNCGKLEELPELAQVQSLTLSNCRNLRSLVKRSDSGSYCLLELSLDNCNNVESLSDQLSQFNKLTYLDLSSHDFETLPSSISDLTSLVTLCLNNCKKLKSVEEVPPSLQFLDAQGCDSLEANALEIFRERLNKKVNVLPLRP